jgi:hypothetical protein
MDMSEGQSCRAQCGANLAAIGGFVCVSGEMVGVSYCDVTGSGVTTIEQTLIVGEVRVLVSAGAENAFPTAVAAKRAIATALGIPEAEVVNLILTTYEADGRAGNLRGDGSSGNVEIDVRYEVLVSPGTSKSDLAKAANELSVANSTENEKFRNAMSDDDVVVASVSLKVAPVTYEASIPMQPSGLPVDTLPTTKSVVLPTTTVADDDDSDDTGKIVAGVVGGIVGLCLLICACGAFFYLYSRKGEI